MFDKECLEKLQLSAKTAIEQAAGRLERASAADDVEAVVGASKELVETVAKVVIDALGGTYGSDVDMPKLAQQTLAALKLHPAGLQDRNSLRKLSQALISAVNALAELRNTDGTGHGRAVASNLDRSHASLAQDAAMAWCSWVLAANRRALMGRVGVDEVASEISVSRVFTRGELPAFLAEHRLPELGENDQRKLGLAVGRRWSVNGTFIPREDVIKPLAAGTVDYPTAFAAGVLEGLVLDYNGYLRIRRDDARLAVNIGLRLPGDRKQVVFEELADRAEDALLSYAFDEEEQEAALRELGALAQEQENAEIGRAIARVGRRIEELREADWDDDETHAEEP